jgi:tetratricopeptide (TPR) repeat protein
VIHAAQEQVNLIQHLRRNMRTTEGRELVHLQAEYAELLGWFTQDLGNFNAAQQWMKQALEWAMVAGDPDMTAYFLARRSQLAGDMGDSLGAVDLGFAAQQQARPGSRLEVIAMTYSAFGHATCGEVDDSSRLLDNARELFAELDDDPRSPWGEWLDESYIEVQRGRCLTAAGQPAKAVDVYELALCKVPAGYHRDRGVYLARQGAAYAGAGQPERAAEIGLQALTIGVSTESGRIITELAHLDNALSAWPTIPQVSDFREAMNEIIPRKA